MDVIESSVAPLKSACSLFLKDLEALPDDAFTKKFTSEARTVADIVFEVNMVNDRGCKLRRCLSGVAHL